MTTEPWLTRRDHDGGIAELILNRGPVNALSADFLLDFKAQIEALTDDASVRAIVLSSPFKVFSAGLDLKEALQFDIDAQHAIVRGLNEGFLALFACPKPTVVAVNGAAIAGGLFFVLGADFRIAGPQSKFGLAEVRVGADFPIGPMEIARAMLDPNDLRRLMLTGRPIGVDAAFASGIVDQIESETENLVPSAIEAARDLADNPPGAYASIKRQIRRSAIDRIRQAIDAGGNAPEGGWFTEETKPAMQRMIG